MNPNIIETLYQLKDNGYYCCIESPVTAQDNWRVSISWQDHIDAEELWITQDADTLEAAFLAAIDELPKPLETEEEEPTNTKEDELP